MKTALWWVSATVALLLVPGLGSAQQEERHPLVVRVRQVAGGNVYLDVGTDHGLTTGDTLPVLRDTGEVEVGRLVVVAGTAVRSVLAFAGDAFPVTRGEVLTLLARRPAMVAPPSVEGVRPAGAQRSTDVADSADAGTPGLPHATPTRAEIAPTGATEGGPGDQPGESPPYGQVSFDLAALHSSTSFGGSDPTSVDRTYATPAVRLRLTVPDGPGGFRFRTSVRLAYRYTDRNVPREPFSPRIYTAALERDFTAVPLRLTLGRFQGPAEAFGGYWDGLLVRFGGRAAGVGIVAGLQPELWNEEPSTDLPKATVYADFAAGSADLRWSADLAFQTERPREEDAPDHTFAGLRQRLQAGALRLHQILQVDRLPDGGWEVSRLRLQAVLRTGSSVDLRANLSRRRSWAPRSFVVDPTDPQAPAPDPLGPERDRASVGISYRAGRAYLAVDGTVSAREGAGEGRGVTGFFSLPGILPGRSLRVSGSASYWTGDRGSSTSLSPAVVTELGEARVRLGYSLHRSDFLDRTTTRHGGDLRLDAPLGSTLRATVRLGGRWGDGLRSERLNVTLVRRFGR